MESLFDYSCKLTLCLAVIYLFYQLALRHLTFYNWNRGYFLIGTGLCLLIPLANVLPLLEREAQQLRLVGQLAPFSAFAGPVVNAGNAAASFGENAWRLLPLLFGLGVVGQAGRLVLQMLSFRRLRQSATLLQSGAVRIYQVDKKIAPFSFGNAIYLNKNLLSPTELPEIIRHESVHIRQKHTRDVLWLEFLSVINWYNPFVWLLRRAARQNLEFIADRAVLQTPGLDKKYYQYLLLKVIGAPDFIIANQFNFSPLKTRMMMMNKTPSSRRRLVRFLLVLPVMAGLVLACSEAELTPNVAPPPPPPSLNEAEMVIEFVPLDSLPERNPNVATLTGRIENHTGKTEDNVIVTARITLKSGEVERYNFKNATELAQFEQKYGKYQLTNPTLSPRLPPFDISEFAMPFLDTDQLPADYKLFLKRHPQVKTIGWHPNGFIMIGFKSAREGSMRAEMHDLNDPISKAAVEKKYGELPKNPLTK